MTKPRLRKVGDGWWCWGVILTRDNTGRLHGEHGDTPGEAFSKWNHRRIMTELSGTWRDRRLLRPPPKPTLIDRLRNWLAR